MPDRDITEKHLEAYNDVFADIVNVLLFDGQRRVCPAVWGVRGGTEKDMTDSSYLTPIDR